MRLRIQALFFLLALFAISAASISPGSTLFASNNQTWASPSGTFSLGFVSVKPLTSSPSFIAAIFYSGGAPVVWSAGNGSSIDAGGSFQFLSTGTLRLVNGSGTTIWDSETFNLGISSATMQDDGNLVLSNGNRSVWSSFDHPTDTLLQSQNFTTGKVLQSGQYSFNLRRNGNLTLSWNNSILFWNQGLNSSVNGTVTKPILELQSVGILQLTDANLTTPVIVAYSSDYAEGSGSDILRFLKLDNDGNLRLYSTPRGSGNSTARWAAVQDQCEVYAYCGSYGICSYSDSTPICGCPSQNFEMIDPNDSRQGCRRKVRIEDCSGNETMLKLDHTRLLTYPPDINSDTAFFSGISACSGNCLSGPCFGSTSLSDGSGQCYQKPQDFASGYQSPALPSTSFVKVCKPVEPNPPPSVGETVKRKKRVPAWVVVVVILGTLVGLISFEGGLWFWCCRNSPRFGGLSAHYALLEYASGAPVQFSYKELQRATKGFKEKLGAGGFGAVYRGTLINKTVVAVKQLEGIEQGEKQFRMEVATISSTHHLNLVRLIGFCSEGRHRLLVYEFMKNGSLDHFLFVTEEQQSGKLLNWEYRFNIAIGTARGITYLHEECRDCIVHCDIKPENILLDENYIAKVSDFGLAKLINTKDHRHRTLTSVRGTRGYLAPEWLANLPITSKSDVYSYGMVLLEIVSGKRNFEVSEDTNRKKFSIWAYEECEKGNINRIVDKRLADQEVNMEQVRRAIQTSFWCIQEQPSQRPTMGRVLQMLEGITEIENPPAPKSVVEGPVSGTSTYLSSNVSALFTASASPQGLSSSSSFQISGVSTGRNIERATSSLLQSDTS